MRIHKDVAASQPKLRNAQSGVVLLVTLIALVIVLVGALALMRSSDTTSVIAGNIAFKRDLTNNAEIGAAAALAQFATGGSLGTAAATYNNLSSSNYSATILDSSLSGRGIPNVLLNDSQFGTVGTATNDLPSSTYGVTIRYVIDRMCINAGAVSAQNCVLSSLGQDTSGNAGKPVTQGTPQVVYRISIRVQGPRNTQAFVQTTVGN